MSDLGGTFAGTALSGPLVLAVLVAAIAGLVSFASPCVLPLVPGYLGYVTGLTGMDLERQRRSRALAGAGLFIAGFTVVFVGYGAAFGALGLVLQGYAQTLTRVLGVVVLLMGLLFLGAGRVLPAWLRAAVDSDRRSSWRPAAGLAGAPLLGVVFGLGWSPCLGPTLAAVNALALDSASPWRGALLATAYAAGLGVPFLLVAAGLGRGSRSVGWLRRHRVAVGRAGGSVLVIVGLLLVTGAWSAWLYRLQATITGVTLPV